MAIRNKKWEKHPKKMRGLLAEKQANQARKLRIAERQKPHSGAKMRLEKAKRRKSRTPKPPTYRP